VALANADEWDLSESIKQECPFSSFDREATMLIDKITQVSGQ